jgi:hypothetical protein
MDQSTEAASPASAQSHSGDGKEQSGNLSLNAAAASLLKKLGTTEESSTPAAAEATPEDAQDATPTETPAADAADTASDSSEPDAESEAQADEVADEAAESAPADEEAAGDVLSPKSSLDQKTKDKVQQRINQAKAAQKAAEAQVELLQQQLAQIGEAQAKTAETPVLANPSPNAPLPEVKDAQQLRALQQQAKEVVRWAEEQLDRDDLGDGIVVEGKTWTKAELKQVVRTAKITLEDKIPAQQDYLAAQARFAQERAKSSTYARTEFPFLADKASPEYQKAQTLLRDPWVQQNPHAEYFVAVFLEGQKALEAKKSASAAKATEAAKPKPKIPAGKPPGDQAAVGANGSTTVRAPAAGANRVVAAEKAKWKSSGGLSASQAAASLQRMTSAKRSL